MIEQEIYESPEVDVFITSPLQVICASEPEPGGNEGVGFENW